MQQCWWKTTGGSVLSQFNGCISRPIRSHPPQFEASTPHRIISIFHNCKEVLNFETNVLSVSTPRGRRSTFRPPGGDVTRRHAAASACQNIECSAGESARNPELAPKTHWRRHGELRPDESRRGQRLDGCCRHESPQSKMRNCWLSEDFKLNPASGWQLKKNQKKKKQVKNEMMHQNWNSCPVLVLPSRDWLSLWRFVSLNLQRMELSSPCLLKLFAKTALQQKKKPTKPTYVLCSDGSGKDKWVIVFKVAAASRTETTKRKSAFLRCVLIYATTLSSWAEPVWQVEQLPARCVPLLKKKTWNVSSH